MPNPSLSELQSWMRAAFTGGGENSETPDGNYSKGVAKGVLELNEVIEETDTLPRNERLRIYGSAYTLRLTRVLGNNFPAIKKVLGNPGFAEMIHRFLNQHPSRFRTIDNVGESLSHFLLGDVSGQTIPYLSDLSRLEWNFHAAHFANDPSPMPDESVEVWFNTPLTFFPSATFLLLQWPVFDIWRKHNSTDLFPETLASQAESILIYRRRDDTVCARRLDPVERDLLLDLQKGTPLRKAIESHADHLSPENLESWVPIWKEFMQPTSP